MNAHAPCWLAWLGTVCERAGIKWRLSAGRYAGFCGRGLGVAAVVGCAAAQGHSGTVVAWDNSGHGATNVPLAITNVVAVAAAYHHALALSSDGMVCGWGYMSNGPVTAPPWLTGAVAIACGDNLDLALRSDGTVVAWGTSTATNVPPDLADVAAISAGPDYGVALTRNGSVRVWGKFRGSVPYFPARVTAISAGRSNILAMTSDGQAISWGPNTSLSAVPADVTNVTAIMAGSSQHTARKGDGALAVWGFSRTVPWNTSGMESMAGYDDYYHVGVLTNGTVWQWDNGFWWDWDRTNSPGVTNFDPTAWSVWFQTDWNAYWYYPAAAQVVGISNAVAAATGFGFGIAILGERRPSTVSIDVPNPSITAGYSETLSAASDGTGPFYYRWRFNGADIAGATNATLALSPVRTTDAGNYSVVVGNAHGETESEAVTLAVRASPPIITIDAYEQALVPGSNMVIQATIDGPIPWRARWQKFGSDIPGATNRALLFENTQPADAAEYQLVVANEFGSSTSSPVRLSLIFDYAFDGPGMPLLWDSMMSGELLRSGKTLVVRRTDRSRYWESGGLFGGIEVHQKCKTVLILFKNDHQWRGLRRCSMTRYKRGLLDSDELGTWQSTERLVYNLPEGESGHWTLDLHVLQRGNVRIATAWLRLDSGRVIELAGEGTYSAGQGAVTLPLRALRTYYGFPGAASSAPRTWAITIRANESDMEIQSLRGKVLAQTLKWP